MMLRVTSVVLFILFSSFGIQAQTTGGNPQNTLLPEINPQDIEIRSEFRARFPGLRRQPILGFNPKPRVFRIDPNRMPFMESRDEAVANVAITVLDRPEPPRRSILKAPDRTNALIKAGIGNFFTPEAEGYFYRSLNDQSAVSGNINYRSSKGHLDDQGSSFRYFDGDVRYTSKINEDLNMAVEAGFLSDFNRMFDLDPSLQSSIGETARKDYLGGGARVHLQHKKNELEGWEVSLGGNIFGVDMDAGDSPRSGQAAEQVVEVALEKHWAGNRLYETFHVSASATAGNYEFSNADAEQWVHTRAAVEYRKMLDFSLHLSAKAGVAYVSDAFSNNVYLAPELKVRYNLRDAVVITGSLFGTPELNNIQDLHETNRFLAYTSPIQHSYRSGVNGEIAFQAFEGNRLFGGLSYELIKDYAYFQRTLEPVLSQDLFGFYDVQYGKANIFELYGGITQQLVPEKFWFVARFYARRPKLSGNGDIPFEERLGLNGSLSYKPAKAVKVSGWAEYVGARKAPSAGDDLSAFLLFNGSAEYQINNKFGVYVKVLNILGQNYQIWDGYEERPLQAFGGITIKL